MAEEKDPLGLSDIGSKTPDGWVYAGISPDTGKPMYAMPVEKILSLSWYQALERAEQLKAEGHKDARLPTPGELAVMFSNRAAIKNFNVVARSPTDDAVWYWSAQSLGETHADAIRFKDGAEAGCYKTFRLSVRFVRS